MIANLVEMLRVAVMISPLSVWPVMTIVLHDKNRKQES